MKWAFFCLVGTISFVFCHIWFHRLQIRMTGTKLRKPVAYQQNHATLDESLCAKVRRLRRTMTQRQVASRLHLQQSSVHIMGQRSDELKRDMLVRLIRCVVPRLVRTHGRKRVTASEICQAIGNRCSRQTVCRYVKKLGLNTRRFRKRFPNGAWDMRHYESSQRLQGW